MNGSGTEELVSLVELKNDTITLSLSMIGEEEATGTITDNTNTTTTVDNNVLIHYYTLLCALFLSLMILVILTSSVG